MLLPIGAYFARNIGAVSRVSVRFLTVDLPPRVKYAGGPPTTFTGSTTAKSGRNIRLGSTVLDRTRAL
jgi:hypothetical protein